MFTYTAKGTCSRQILFDVDSENKMHNVRFIGGCGGNLQGIARLVEGKDINEIEALLAGIRCKGNTSCPDQLSKAIAAMATPPRHRITVSKAAKSFLYMVFLHFCRVVGCKELAAERSIHWSPSDQFIGR